MIATAGIGDVQLAVNADMTQFSGQVVKGAEKAGDKASKGFSKSFTKNLNGKDLLGGLGLGQLAGIGALTVGTAALTNVIFKSIDAASDQREAMSLGTQVFEDQTGVIEKWAAGAADAFGQSKTEAINFASSFGNAFKNVGFAIDETAQKSMDLTHLAADLGSAFNKSSDEAATALRSGLLGESEPLRAFGVFLSEAAVDAELMRRGQKKVNGAWTDGQKVLARYNIIMKQTADSQGMFGRDTESLADAQKSLAADLDNLQAEFGTKLLPVLVDFVNLVKDDVLPGLVGVAGAIGDVDSALADFKFNQEDTAGATDNLGSRTTLLGSSLHSLADVLTAVIDDQRVFLGLTDKGGLAIEHLSGAFDDSKGASAEYQTAIGKASAKTDDLGDNADTAKGKVRDLKQELLDTASALIDQYYDPIQLREDLLANKSDAAAQRRILASKNASAAEKRDAHDALTAIARDTDEKNLKLLATGKMTKKELNAWIAQLKGQARTGTADTKRYVASLIAEIKRLDGMTATVNIDITQRIRKLYNNEHGKAVGGPVTAHKPYLVGEIGPEMFVPDSYGQIITAKETERILSGGGGDTLNYNVTLLDRMEARSVRDIGDGLRILGERGYLDRHRRRRR